MPNFFGNNYSNIGTSENPIYRSAGISGGADSMYMAARINDARSSNMDGLTVASASMTQYSMFRFVASTFIDGEVIADTATALDPGSSGQFDRLIQHAAFYTIPQDGFYHMSVNVLGTGDPPGSYNFLVDLFVNDTLERTLARALTGNDSSANYSGIINFTAGTQLKIGCTHGNTWNRLEIDYADWSIYKVG